MADTHSIRKATDTHESASGGNGERVPHPGAVDVAVAFSHAALAPAEQMLFRRLSVFSGGSTLSSAEAVCSGNGLRAEDVFENLVGLVACSLVRADTRDPEARYSMPRAVKRLAFSRLVAAGEAPGAERHARWVLAIAELAESQLSSPSQRAVAERLDIELANLRAGLAWLLRERFSSEAISLAGSLTLWWWARGALREGRLWLDRTLAMPEEVLASIRGKALWGAGLLAAGGGNDTKSATRLLDKSLAIGQALDDDVLCGRALLVLGDLLRRDDPRAALDTLAESISRAGSAQDWWCVARGLLASARAHRAEHRLADARAAVEQSMALARQIGDSFSLAEGLVELGRLVITTGDSWSADTLLAEAERVARASGRDDIVAAALVGLGDNAANTGDYELAARRFGDALAIARRVGLQSTVTLILVRLARVALAGGDRVGGDEYLDAVEATANQRGEWVAGLDRTRAQLVPGKGQRGAASGAAQHALATARAARDDGESARALLVIAQVARRSGKLDAATAAVRESIILFERQQDLRGLLDAMEALAGIGVSRSRFVHSARLFGAAASLRNSHRQARVELDSPTFGDDVAILRDRLVVDDLEGAWFDGAALSAQEAVAMCRKDPADVSEEDGGWERLTKSERVIVGLVAEGLTNKQIAERLSVSRHTVQSHLAHVFAKLGIGSRTVLAREATTRQQARGPRPAGRPVGLPEPPA